jgi:hypothetical protein
LPIFLQKEGWEIDVFQSNYRRGIKPGSFITAGTKTLKFVEIIKSSRKSSTNFKSETHELNNYEKANNKFDNGAEPIPRKTKG